MRLGVNGWRAPGRRTGIGRYLVNLLSRWTPEVVGDRFERVTVYSHLPLDPATVPLADGIRSRVLRPPARMLVWENLRFGPAADDDVLFCPSFSRPLVARGRTVVAIHDVVPVLHPELYPSTQPLYNRLYAWGAHHAHTVLTSTVACADDITRVWGVAPGRIHVVPLAAADALHPVDAGEAATTAARLVGSAAPYLLFVGKMSGRRRAPLLVESFAAFRQATGAPHLLVMAGPPPEPEVGETADRLGVGELVRHLGFVDDHDLNVLYNGAAAVVCPSVYENVSLPIMDAQATGRPVVCVDAPGAREITAGAAVFMPRLDVGSLVAAIRRVIEDPALAAELGDAGLANSRQYSWDRTAAETITVLADAGA